MQMMDFIIGFFQIQARSRRSLKKLNVGALHWTECLCNGVHYTKVGDERDRGHFSSFSNSG